MLAVALYAAFSLLAVLTSSQKAAAVGDFARIALPFAFLWAGAGAFESGLSPAVLSWVLASYAVVPVITGALQAAGIVDPVEGAVGSPGGVMRVTGLYQHPYDIAMRCSVAFPFALSLGMSLRRRPVRYAFLVWGVVLALAGTAALVRTCAVAIFGQIVTWLLLYRRRFLALSVIGLSVASVIVVPPFRAIVTEAWRPIREGAIYELGTGRAWLFVAQFSAFNASSLFGKAFGHGLHMVPSLNVEYAPIPAVALGSVDLGEGNIGAHDQYLRALTETGIFGLLALLAILARAAWLVARAWRLHKHEPVGDFAAATLVLVLSVSVTGLSYQPLDQPAVTWPLLLAIGYAASAMGRPRDNRAN